MALAEALLVVPDDCSAARPGDVFDAVLLP